MTKKATKPKSITTWPLFIILAALMMPRVVAHDLRLFDSNSTAYQAMALIPLLIWLVVVLMRKTKQPIHDYLILGGLYGLFLGLTHQITWEAAWGSNPPHLGGNMVSLINPMIESLLMRFATLLSSLGTGLATGLIFGLIGTAAQRLRKT